MVQQVRSVVGILLVCSAVSAALLAAGCGGSHGTPSKAIAGTVSGDLSAGPQPIEGALVIIAGKKALTNAQGQFRVEDVPVGEEPVPITVSGANYLTYDSTIVPNVSSNVDILLQPVSDPGAAGTLTGRVLADENGAGIGQVPVIAEALVGDVVASSMTAHTADDGAFQLSGFPTGPAQVRVEVSGRLPYKAGLTVNAGEANPPIEIRLKLGTLLVTVTGLVFDLQTYARVPGATVSAGTGLQATTGGDGTFEIANVPAGPQTIVVTASGYETATRGVAVAPDMAALEFGLIATASAPPALPYNLSGRVTLGGATDYSGVSLILKSGAGATLEQTITDSEGRYYFWYFPGTYVVRAEKTGYVAQERQVVLILGGTAVADFSLASQ